ncbi:hypothetical protein LguiA_026187 [Lonicera macranthoides]
MEGGTFQNSVPTFVDKSRVLEVKPFCNLAPVDAPSSGDEVKDEDEEDEKENIDDDGNNGNGDGADHTDSP